jgi:alkylation response protein AidB-like acyl-CoA dehydrogenase
MGLEVASQYGGAAASFFDIVLVVEELARIDPSVSVFVDVQNTLVTPIVQELGTQQQKEKYLPHLHKDWVGHRRESISFAIALHFLLGQVAT